MCGALTDGAPYCAEHSAAAERLEAQPWRAGYSDPEYLRSREERRQIAGGRCEECGEELGLDAECDHEIPLRDGGTNLVSNLRWRCVGCHRAKTRRDRRRRRER